MGYSEDIYNLLPTAHHNLCGELAVMQALGISLQEGFARFSELGESYFDILANDTECNSQNLKKLIDAFSETGWTGSSAATSTDDVATRLASGEKIIALVTIDVNQDGAVAGDGQTNHWVEIKEINNSTNEITYYNPFTNEISNPVSITDFESAWQAASETGSQVIVSATQ
jgi:hypothetical protein